MLAFAATTVTLSPARAFAVGPPAMGATGAQQRDSAAPQVQDTARRPRAPNAPASSSDTLTSAERARRVASEDSARAQSTADVAERRRSLGIGNIGAIAALVVFGSAALAFAILLILAFSRGSSIEVETRWSGIGGGGGGWRLSSSFSFLLAALLFGGLFASTVWALLRVGEPAPRSAVAPASKDSLTRR
jgi:hypothetical protein